MAQRSSPVATPRLPFGFNDINDTDHKNLFDTYNPDFYQNVELGYIRDTFTHSYSGYRTSLASNEGIVLPKEDSVEVVPTSRSGIDTVEVVSDDAGDTGLLAVIGCETFGEEFIEVVQLNGTTPVTLTGNGDGLWLTVHTLLYAPVDGFTSNNTNLGTIRSTSQLTEGDATAENAAYREVVMQPETNKGSNCIFRCPKYQRTLLPSIVLATQGSNNAQGLFQWWERYFPGDFGWYKLGVLPVSKVTSHSNSVGKRGLQEGDFFMLTAQNMGPGNNDEFYWNFRLVQSILDSAPPGYERPWLNPYGGNPWDLVPTG